AYKEAGRLEEAINLLEHVMADRERILGNEDLALLRSRNSLAAAYEDAGYHSQAIALYERNLTEAERILDPAHPRIAKYRRNLDQAEQDQP
ncbi:tetratricopeptide repeat protein, partial [Streptomyces sp. NPDC051642]|uniref:tetratricopeptide repeat protein n=1 Tax=Streptomyces sp. NPDC051642 TaxID=3154646 RepID=UPI0034291E02